MADPKDKGRVCRGRSEDEACERAAQETLEVLLLEGLNSGEPIEVTPEFWERLRQRVRDRAAEKERAKRVATRPRR